MTKEERQKKSEELKAQRKEKALQRKKAKEEKDQEKVRLKREEHKAVLKRAKELLRRTEAASTAVHEEDAPPTIELYPEPSMLARGTDPLETSLVEPGPLLVSLNPFEGEEEPVIHPTSVGELEEKPQDSPLEEKPQDSPLEGRHPENKQHLNRKEGRPQVRDP